jgi:Annexin
VFSARPESVCLAHGLTHPPLFPDQTAATWLHSFCEISRLAVNLIQNKEEYFAERLQQAVKGTGTNDDKLIRIFVSRMDKDLKGIDKAFQKLYGKNLVALINVGLLRQPSTSNNFFPRKIMLCFFN